MTGGDTRPRGENVGKALPKFKYIPDPVGSGIFTDKDVSICDCCGQTTGIYYSGGIYTKMTPPEVLCPECIHSGKAAEKYQGNFQDILLDELAINTDFTDELRLRTPSYVSWQSPVWPSHCGDYCAFINYVGFREIEKMGLDWDDLLQVSGFRSEDLKEGLVNEGSLQGYLFQCLDCGQFCLYADCD